jgi:cell division ATPase FtsA
VHASHTVNRGSQDITAAISKSLDLTVERAEVLKREMGLIGPDTNLTSAAALVLDHIWGEIKTTLLTFEKK